MTHQIAGVEIMDQIAGVENDGPNNRGRKRRTWKMTDHRELGSDFDGLS